MTVPGTIEFRQVPKPVPRDDEVLVRVRRIGVCGSDIHVYHGRHPLTNYPVVQGHEFSAVLEALGPGVCHEGYASCFFRRLENGEWKVADERTYDPRAVYGAKP